MRVIAREGFGGRDRLTLVDLPIPMSTRPEEHPVMQNTPLHHVVIVGGGPTGVALVGSLGELAHTTRKGHFRAIDPTQVTIFLVEGGGRVLPGFPADLSAKAALALRR